MMKLYRCFFYASDEMQVRGYCDFEAAKDSHAIQIARHFHKQQPKWRGFELWRGRYRVHLEVKAELPGRPIPSHSP
jgi:hypothetical protein